MIEPLNCDFVQYFRAVAAQILTLNSIPSKAWSDLLQSSHTISLDTSPNPFLPLGAVVAWISAHALQKTWRMCPSGTDAGSGDSSLNW